MASSPQLIAFSSRALLASRLADFLEAVLARGVAERGAASLALSGGTTPAALYGELSRRNIAWEKVTATLVDERFVRPGEPGSNESFVRQTFLTGHAAGVCFIGLKGEAGTPAEAACEAGERLQSVLRPFDAVVLGMGADGHTASWFPYAEGLEAALHAQTPPVVAIRAVKSAATGEHRDRISLSLSAISNARTIILLLTGEEKRAAFERALAGVQVEEMPVRAILRARPDLWVSWAA